MIPRSRYALVVGSGCALAGVLLSGCGGEKDPDAGTNGVGRLAPDRIEAKTRAAAESAKSVRMAGTVVSQGKRFRLDMRLKEGGGVGQVSSGGSTFELLKVGKDLFLKADGDFYRGHKNGAGGAAGGKGDAAAKLEGKYVKVPSEDPSYKKLSGFTDLKVLLDGFFVLDGELAEGDHGTVNGRRTVALTADGGRGGTVEVALEGEPYPLRYSRAGGAGTLELSDYNKDFELKAPDAKHIVDYGEQISGSGQPGQ
ncbi:lipoprotein [Wenjunlia tyrosinilytica]|uniref:Lipoprotein n=1 Tax=Wenjunlia tyrosinilytica TaxID=1544741 RepID=A0A917ZNL9_9ACTN|nr:lipoprotein [Wenjunlia tyrosinilytica]